MSLTPPNSTPFAQSEIGPLPSTSSSRRPSDKWDQQTQIREECYFTRGRVIVQGKTVKRGKANKADYILFYKPNFPIAVIEAEDNNHAVGEGMQQALDYAEILDVPFAYSSNGDGFLEHDRTVSGGTVEREFALNEFPTAAGASLA